MLLLCALAFLPKIGEFVTWVKALVVHGSVRMASPVNAYPRAYSGDYLTVSAAEAALDIVSAWGAVAADVALVLLLYCAASGNAMVVCRVSNACLDDEQTFLWCL